MIRGSHWRNWRKRGKFLCFWVNTNNDFMMNFCKILIICNWFTIKPSCHGGCWARNDKVSSSYQYDSQYPQLSSSRLGLESCFPGLLWCCGPMCLLVDNELEAEMIMTHVMVKPEHFISDARPPPPQSSLPSGTITRSIPGKGARVVGGAWVRAEKWPCMGQELGMGNKPFLSKILRCGQSVSSA